MSLLAKGSGVLTRVVRRCGVRSMGAATNDPSQTITPTKPPVSVAVESDYVREISKWPLGYDSECFHTVEHSQASSAKWLKISLWGSGITGSFMAYQFLFKNHHGDAHPPVEYEYHTYRHRVPRFPWGDRNLIGTPYQREEWAKEDAEA
ncbi:hypothetical protein NDN08_000431 [Rhodosorus marinus]|uniref:Uncharacterized protein n=1 Tax=Rhodosorus marinus TaxID=101924 RepID=A0AAV8UMW9_9RHOD|nr:hypothetical protein NDN08_000431 [Rhodosorus marinus]